MKVGVCIFMSWYAFFEGHNPCCTWCIELIPSVYAALNGALKNPLLEWLFHFQWYIWCIPCREYRECFVHWSFYGHSSALVRNYMWIVDSYIIKLVHICSIGELVYDLHTVHFPSIIAWHWRPCIIFHRCAEIMYGMVADLVLRVLFHESVNVQMVMLWVKVLHSLCK